MKETKVINNNETVNYLSSIIDINHSKSNKKTKFRSINSIFKELKAEISINYPEYFIKSSAGSGSLAEVPWIMFSNPEITKGASSGYYIVILFDAIERTVIFSLVYSWTPFKTKWKTKNGLIRAKRFSTKLRERIGKELNISNYDQFTKEIGSGNLAKGYSAGSIISKTIKQNDLKDFDFISTMKTLGTYYDFIQENLLGGLTFDNFIENFKDLDNIDEVISQTEEKYLSSLDVRNISVYDGYNNTSSGYVASRLRPPIARDSHKSRRDSQSKVGDQGEKIVELYENNILKGTKNTARILSTDGDGYDVLSYEENGKEKYIEVKSTKAQNRRVTFYITQNELDKAKKIQNYYLYIVIGVGSKNPKIFKYFKPFGDKKNDPYSEFRLIATKYKVTIDLKN